MTRVALVFLLLCGLVALVDAVRAPTDERGPLPDTSQVETNRVVAGETPGERQD